MYMCSTKNFQRYMKLHSDKHTLTYRYGAQVLVEAIGEIQESPIANPLKLQEIFPACILWKRNNKTAGHISSLYTEGKKD